MRKIFTTMICCLSVALLNAQEVTLTFTGRDVHGQYVPLSRVVVSNITKGWQETLTWPDTELVMTVSGTDGVERWRAPSLRLSQNNPNPFDGTTFVNLQVGEPGDVEVVVTDMTGRVVGTNHVGANNYSPLQPGSYEINITLSSAGVYFLTVRQNGRTATVKMVSRGNGDGNGNTIRVSDVVEQGYAPSLPQAKSSHRSTTDNPFSLGDQMEYVGFAILNGVEVESSHVTQAQHVSETIVHVFPNVQPCFGATTVTDIDGNEYGTIQIGSQCWMKENLRTRRYADGDSIPVGTNYSTTEAYYDDNTSIIPLAERGYLYNWLGAMHGAVSSSAVPSGVQGVCPEGWHLPSAAEWTLLTNYVSSQPGYICGGNPIYIAKALASKLWWSSYSEACCPGDQSTTSNDATGFSAVPAGSYWSYGYDDTGMYANFWSSTEFESIPDIARYFGLDYESLEAYHAVGSKDHRFSVRCLRN